MRKDEATLKQYAYILSKSQDDLVEEERDNRASDKTENNKRSGKGMGEQDSIMRTEREKERSNEGPTLGRMLQVVHRKSTSLDLLVT